MASSELSNHDLTVIIVYLRVYLRVYYKQMLIDTRDSNAITI